MAEHWWAREGLDYREGELHLGRQNLADLVKSAGTPTWFSRRADRLHQYVSLQRRHRMAGEASARPCQCGFAEQPASSGDTLPGTVARAAHQPSNGRRLS